MADFRGWVGPLLLTVNILSLRSTLYSIQIIGKFVIRVRGGGCSEISLKLGGAPNFVTVKSRILYPLRFIGELSLREKSLLMCHGDGIFTGGGVNLGGGA